MTKKVFCVALCAMLFALSVSAQAQQPTKIPRIGYLSGAFASTSRTAARHSDGACASLGMWRGKTLSLSGEMQTGNSITYPRLRPS